MKFMLRLCLVILGLLWAQSAFAACTTGYAFNPGNWATSGTFYTATNGGGSACTLANGDAVVFDANTKVGSYTIAASVSIISLTTTAAVAGPPPAGVYVLHSAGQTLTLSTAGTYDFTGISYCNANPCTAPVSSVRTISITNTSGTVSIKMGSSLTAPFNQLGTVTFNNSGGTTELLDNIILQTSPTFTAGTLQATANNSNPTIPALTIPAVGTVNCGTGTWTFNSAGAAAGTNLFNVTSGSTINCASATFNFSAAQTGYARSVTIQNGNSFGTWNVSFAGAIGPSEFIVTGANSSSTTIATLNFTNVAYPVFISWSGGGTGTTYNITNAPTTWSGPGVGQYMTFFSTTIAQQTTINLPSALAVSWMQFFNMKFTGGAVTATNSIDLNGNNTGVTITAPSYGGGHIIGG